MNRKPRVLLVAVGGYGHVYLREMTERDTGAILAGIVEVMPDIEQRRPVIGQRHIPLYRSLEAFYAADAADLAIISAPIHLHTAMALYCMRHGSHVLCEKPLCLTVEEAEQMAACARETGRFLAIGYQLNYRRDVQAMKRDILAGRFGAPKRLRVVHAFRRGANYYARNNWAGHVTVDGREVFDSPFTNACAHNFQMATFLLGKDMASACGVTGVDAELYRGNPNVENYDIAALRFQTDAGVPLLYYTAHPLRTNVFGPYGRFEFEHGVITYDRAQHYQATLEDGTVIRYDQQPIGDMQKLEDALDCVRHGGAPVCGVAAELPHIRAVRMVQACPVRAIDPGHVDVVQEEEDTFWYVRGLEEKLLQAADAWALPGECGITL